MVTFFWRKSFFASNFDAKKRFSKGGDFHHFHHFPHHFHQKSHHFPSPFSLFSLFSPFSSPFPPFFSPFSPFSLFSPLTSPFSSPFFSPFFQKKKWKKSGKKVGKKSGFQADFLASRFTLLTIFAISNPDHFQHFFKIRRLFLRSMEHGSARYCSQWPPYICLRSFLQIYI